MGKASKQRGPGKRANHTILSIGAKMRGGDLFSTKIAGEWEGGRERAGGRKRVPVKTKTEKYRSSR